MTTICGKSIVSGCPRIANASWSWLTVSISWSILVRSNKTLRGRPSTVRAFLLEKWCVKWRKYWRCCQPQHFFNNFNWVHMKYHASVLTAATSALSTATAVYSWNRQVSLSRQSKYVRCEISWNSNRLWLLASITQHWRTKSWPSRRVTDFTC